jgi:CRISPR system Cascade subunit CasE
MSFLTQAYLDYEVAGRMRLTDVYDWHQLVWRAFPGLDGQRRDYLTRLERRERERRFRLLILSPRPPQRPADWPSELEAWQTREVKPSFLAYRRYRFQLRANPTKRENKTRKRVALRTDEEHVEWLKRKAEQAGFLVDEDALRAIPEGREWFRIEKANKSGFHHAVEFEGVLTVTDAAAFQTAFEKGIGSAKAFGFGLLALVPVV